MAVDHTPHSLAYLFLLAQIHSTARQAEGRCKRRAAEGDLLALAHLCLWSCNNPGSAINNRNRKKSRENWGKMGENRVRERDRENVNENVKRERSKKDANRKGKDRIEFKFQFETSWGDKGSKIAKKRKGGRVREGRGKWRSSAGYLSVCLPCM